MPGNTSLSNVHRLVVLVVVPFLVSGCDMTAQNHHPVSPKSTPTAALGALPTPTNYKSVCDLEASVCSCVGQYQASYCGQSLPASLIRPLRMPTVAPGQACPTTPGHQVTTADFGGYALGDGVVEPIVLGGGQLDREADGWYGFKTLWFVMPSYSDAVFVRGARIDGSGPVGFGEAPFIGHLIIPPGPTLNGTNGYRQAPGGTFVKTAGCYAWQVDGADFTYVIVFQAIVKAAVTPTSP